jgi:hypothetical protein
MHNSLDHSLHPNATFIATSVATGKPEGETMSETVLGVGFRRWRAWASCGMGALLLIVGGCGSPDAAPAASEVAATEVSESAEPTPATPSSQAIQSVSYLPAEPVWWSGFEIELVRASADPANHSVTIEAKVGSTAAIDTNLISTRSQIAVRFADRVFSTTSGTDTVPHGDTITTELVFPGLPDDFDLSAAEVVMGDADQHQAVFPLGDTSANASAQATRPEALPGSVTIKNARTKARFESQDIRLVPAACSGTNPAYVQYVPLQRDQLVLELVGTLESPSTSVGGVAAQVATATPAGGNTSVSEPGMSEVLGAANAPLTDYHLCFPLPAATQGLVEFRFDTRLVGEEFVTARGTYELP